MTGTGITLTNNGMKDIMKVIKSLEIEEFYRKELPKKITNQEGELKIQLVYH